MEHITPCFANLPEPFRNCFRVETFETFRQIVVAWCLCGNKRTLTEVWQMSACNGQKHIDAIYHLFSKAQWDWDQLGDILFLKLISLFAPAGFLWIVVDDTLCHKRGKKIAFGGMHLDPVASSRRRKVFAYGVNYVVVGIVFRLPFRPGRYHCFPIRWRVCIKKGQTGHQKRTELAAELVRQLCKQVPTRDVYLVGDSAYVNKTLLRDRPKNLHMIGPMPLKAALHQLPQARQPGQRGRNRVMGDRLATPKEMFDEFTLEQNPIQAMSLVQGYDKLLQIHELSEVLWYTGCKAQPVKVVLVRDLMGHWPDVAMLCTDVGRTWQEVLQGYERRWSIEMVFHDSKQYLGLEDPQVRSEESVKRAHPMAWFCYSLTLLWQVESGAEQEVPRRNRPWYTEETSGAFTEVLATLRFVLWKERIFGTPGDLKATPDVLEMLLYLIKQLSIVG